jgi:hypothetical protein
VIFNFDFYKEEEGVEAEEEENTSLSLNLWILTSLNSLQSTAKPLKTSPSFKPPPTSLLLLLLQGQSSYSLSSHAHSHSHHTLSLSHTHTHKFPLTHTSHLTHFLPPPLRPCSYHVLLSLLVNSFLSHFLPGLFHHHHPLPLPLSFLLLNSH